MVIDRRFGVYLIGGASSAAIDILIFQGLLLYGANLVLATSAGFFVSLLFNYLFHAKFTFSSNARVSSFGKYLMIVGINYLLSLSLVTLGANFLNSPLAGKIIALPLVAFIGYLAGKHWIFR